MRLEGAKVLVCGASGALGGALARALHAQGAQVVGAGRDPDRVAAVAAELGTEGLTLDVVDTDACAATVEQAVAALGGLDLLVVTVGVAGFGRAVEADPAVAEELLAVNALGPMALVRAAGPHLTEAPGGEGVAVVLSAVLADLPTAGMAEYSAAKAALSAWLDVVRREERRSFRVLDVRPPHLDTDLETRALAGEPPRLPAPYPSSRVVEVVLEALTSDAREARTAKAAVVEGGELVLR
ncbi:SDR family NAD(P)-dependent oxidoreductase [Nocardioides perillae]|uniref:NAD(P)-dependent dehydrogenase (Short-subunit alcohol dehydrogenase family) n=1 Tax=Nocardioides perillae TaxID=1119534 RepID=A0A7Y9UKX7_9ACTN|nr:NAD(P)-dependent dehydrogenase (short-subunit alcohol dehydrogenase family) [Nocardioides perillae]